MNNKNILWTVKKMGVLSSAAFSLKEELNKTAFFGDLSSWCCTGIFYNCVVSDGVLYDCNGNELSTDGRCMNENIPYFVNQSTGYICDDFYGTLFVKVDNKNTFVSIYYEC